MATAIASGKFLMIEIKITQGKTIFDEGSIKFDFIKF